jgi:hypothetical protein
MLFRFWKDLSKNFIFIFNLPYLSILYDLNDKCRIIRIWNIQFLQISKMVNLLRNHNNKNNVYILMMVEITH